MRKLLIVVIGVFAAITFTTAIPTSTIPMASANPYPCLNGGAGTDGDGGPNCRACVVNTPASQTSAVCFGQGVVGQNGPRNQQQPGPQIAGGPTPEPDPWGPETPPGWRHGPVEPPITPQPITPPIG